MFSLIYAWINDWVNNREAGDLRRQHGHYDVIVMNRIDPLRTVYITNTKQIKTYLCACFFSAVLFFLFPATMPITRTLRQCALQTSLKGIPRALKAEQWPNKYLWWISTALFLGLAVWQVQSLVAGYLQYNYATQEIKSPEKEGTYANEITNPVFTFCNLNPFHGDAYSTMERHGLNDLFYYKHSVENLTECVGCSDDDRELLSMVRRELLMPRGYFALVGPTFASHLSHKRDDFIAACNIRESRTIIPYERNCTDDLFTELIHPDYYSCWTMKMPESNGSVYESVSFVLHLNNFFTDQYDFLPINHERGQLLGAILVIHPVGTFPVPANDAIFLQPGGFINIKLTVQGRNRLGEPYDPCTNNEAIANTSWVYTRDACISNCLETNVSMKCGCRTLDHLGVLAKQTSPPFCLDSNVEQAELRRRVRCNVNQTEMYLQKCDENCPRPCEQYTHVPRVSSARWPPDPFSPDFYRRFIKNKSYEEMYDGLKEYFGAYFKDSNVSDWVSQGDIISKLERNFLRVDIQMNNIDITISKDVATTSLPTLISNLGGTLNLFAGITIVLFVEIIDMLILCLCDRQPVDDDANVENRKVNPA